MTAIDASILPLTDPRRLPAPGADILACITSEQANRLRVAPVGLDGTRLQLAMENPEDDAAADEISVTADRPVSRIPADAKVIAELLRRHYGTTAAELGSRLAAEAGDEEALMGNLEAIDAEALHRMAEQPTLINLVNLIILEAIRSRASDIHVEPFESRLAVKYRIDGVLAEQTAPPRHLQPAITSRIKIMAGMNIAERYVPQDGHITLRFEGRKVDIRVSTVPTVYGESVVMRLLDKESISLDLKSLGMRDDHRASIEKLIQLPHGMVLVSGPTGSGKTTTLYAALMQLYSPTKKIITIEDPVEYELSGINQIPVNPKRGLTFATGLRSILRQDPDVIMVGEIRDRETADIAVRSALTGHLLFSTIHTNDAASAVGRLIDMGVEPFLLGSVLEGVVAQRLGRRLDPEHAVRAPIPDAVRHRLHPHELAMFPDGTCMQPRTSAGPGAGSGYRGRLGFYEILMISGPLREGVGQRRPAHELLKLAGSSHITMRTDGLRKAADGQTSIDEVFRATQDADDGA